MLDCSLENIARLFPLLFSEKKLDEWFSLFDEKALIVRLEEGKPVTCLNIREAMPEQREYADENSFFNEEWDKVEIHRYGNMAVIKADYILTVDSEIRKGLDVLTLCQDDQGWRIINLVYEQKEFIRR